MKRLIHDDGEHPLAGPIDACHAAGGGHVVVPPTGEAVVTVDFLYETGTDGP